MKLEKQIKDHNSLTSASNSALGSTQERRQVHRDISTEAEEAYVTTLGLQLPQGDDAVPQGALLVGS